jgi:ATP-dependent helicase/nuclease subunit B
MANVFNIPSNYFFLNTLAFWLEEKFGKEIASIKIILPSKRAARELQEILPQTKIIAISDLSSSHKVLSGIDQILFLVDEIKKQRVFGELDFEQSFKIALRLRDLFDEIEREQIDVKKFFDLDDSDLSLHRQVTLDFIKNFYVQIRNSLLKKDLIFSAANQNLAIDEFIKSLKSDDKIIIAGSTGSVPANKNLIKAISKLPNGFVVLQGVLEGDFAEENHPQFFVNQLVKFLESAPKNITNEKFLMSSESRKDVISALMLSSQKTLEWQRKKVEFDTENVRLIEAENEIEEAEAIVEILSKEKNAALVTNNYDLAKLVKIRLKQLSINFNDARSLNIFDSKLINFLLLIAEVKENDFESHSLLSLLKHPLCFSAEFPEIIADFEIKIIRQDRANPGLKGILQKLRAEVELEKFFNEFLENFTASPIQTAQNLSKKSWDELLSPEVAKKEISEFFAKLEERNYLPQSLAEFKMMVGLINYFEEFDNQASIQILSRIEARLLNFDLIVVASLNEGDFPEIESENWLGKKIRKDLGIDNSLKKIGQSAFDFSNYFANKSVVLTRSKSRSGVTLIESPFLLKLKVFCQKNQINLINYKKPKRDEVSKINDLAPFPKKELRPKKFSITEISKLISDPYFIYAKKILQLRELPKIDFESSYAEFGSFVHKALEEFIKNPGENNFEKIFEKYFSSNEAKLIWWPKFEKIFSNFVEDNEVFSSYRSEVEKWVSADLSGIEIVGKVDRIIFDDDGAAQIFDYKTGVLPSKKDVISGIEPQLTLAALALANEYKISSLNYWKLSYSKEGEIKNISKDQQEIEDLIRDTRKFLEGIFGYFADGKNPYAATKETSEGEYKNLARRL